MSRATHCPAWCELAPGRVDKHDGPDTGLGPDDSVTHSCGVGGFILDEHRNQVTGRVVREGQGSVEVALRLHVYRGALDATVVELRHVDDVVALTTGEARSLAALLVRAADLGDGIDSAPLPRVGS